MHRWTPCFAGAWGLAALVGCGGGAAPQDGGNPADSDLGDSAGTGGGSSVGAACTPSPELSATFAGFDEDAVVLDEGNPGCSTGTCLVNHFQGRTTCAYGQDANGDSPAGVPACTVPGTSTPVRPAADGGPPGDTVPPQCTTRRPKDAVYCSCRCANAGGRTDDGADYCSCPSGYTCAQLVPAVVPGDPRSGGYCIVDGTELDVGSPCTPCDPAVMDCR